MVNCSYCLINFVVAKSSDKHLWTSSIIFKICFNNTECISFVWVNAGLENVYVFVMNYSYCQIFVVAKSSENPL